MNQLVDDLRRFIIEEIGWKGSAEALTAEYPLIDNKVIDSIAAFQIVSFVEDEYDVLIDDSELVAANFKDLHAIARLVESKKTA